MLQAFILVTVTMGRAAATATTLRTIDGVRSAELVTGPYDVVVDIEASNVDALGVLIQDHVQQVAGVVRTLTCPVFHL